MITKAELNEQIRNLEAENKNQKEEIEKAIMATAFFSHDQIENLKEENRNLKEENRNLKQAHANQIKANSALTDRINRCEYLVASHRKDDSLTSKALIDKIQRYEYLVASYRAVVTNLSKSLEREQQKNKNDVWL